MCNRLVVIKDGKLIWQGLTSELLEKAKGSNRLEDAFIELVINKEGE